MYSGLSNKFRQPAFIDGNWFRSLILLCIHRFLVLKWYKIKSPRTLTSEPGDFQFGIFIIGSCLGYHAQPFNIP